jgi:hypothetical protein
MESCGDNPYDLKFVLVEVGVAEEVGDEVGLAGAHRPDDEEKGRHLRKVFMDVRELRIGFRVLDLADLGRWSLQRVLGGFHLCLLRQYILIILEEF